MRNLQHTTFRDLRPTTTYYDLRLGCIVLLFVVSCLLLVFPVFADTAEPQDFTYLLHLYYDNGQLFADRDVKFKYDVLPETFVPETFNTQFYYKGEVVNLKGEVAKTFQFDPRQGNPNFLKGTLSVKAPYVSDGQKVNFYDSQGKQLLSIFVSDSSFCNDDGVCNADVGEDHTTCPSDCKTATSPVVSPQSPVVSGGAGGVLKGIIYLIIGLGVVGGFWRWRRRKQSLVLEMPTNLPPTISNGQSPTQ